VDVGWIAHHFAGAEHEADIGLGKSAAQARYQFGMMQRRQKTHDTSWADLYTRSRLIGSSLASVTIGRSSVSPVHVMAMRRIRGAYFLCATAPAFANYASACEGRSLLERKKRPGVQGRAFSRAAGLKLHRPRDTCRDA